MIFAHLSISHLIRSESSSGVRVTEEKAEPLAHAGISASQGNFAIA